MRQQPSARRMAEVAAAQTLSPLQQGELKAAEALAEKQQLPLSLARLRLVAGDPAAALATLEPLRQQAEDKGWQDERLKVMVLRAMALQALDETEQALQALNQALRLAEPGGFVRIFIDEGPCYGGTVGNGQAPRRGFAADTALNAEPSGLSKSKRRVCRAWSSL